MAKKAATPWKKKLNKLRARYGVSQLELAERLGVSLNTLRGWLYKGNVPGGAAAKLIDLLLSLSEKSEK